MNESSDARQKQWSAFLDQWPVERLPGMSIAEYTRAGDPDCFVNWLEGRTESLGSIWGGSAFKFGIYSRKDRTEKGGETDRIYSDDYGWYSKYGATPTLAFERVRALVVEVAHAAREGRYDAIDAVDLGSTIKWKIAFLYQDRVTPRLLPIYKADYLRAVLNSNERQTAVLHARLLERCVQVASSSDSRDIFDQADLVWSWVQEAIKTELTPTETKAFLETSDRFSAIGEPNQKIAGFQTAEGEQLALLIDNPKTTIFLQAGDWIDPIRSVFQEVVTYPAEKVRQAVIASVCPALAVGKPLHRVVVPDMKALIALCDAYDTTSTNSPSPERRTMTDTRAMKPALNQILYGPPGTGKTYHTVDAALEILDPDFLAEHHTNRLALKRRFDALASAGHIRFVTFHQSFSYEDFVEGLRAESRDDGQLRYAVADGVFKSLCVAAAAKVTQSSDEVIDTAGRTIWKVSLGDSSGSDAYIYDECVEQGQILIGYGAQADFTGCGSRLEIQSRLAQKGYNVDVDSYEVTAVNIFVNRMKVGDLVVVSQGNSKFRAIGEITSGYRLINRDREGDTYGQCRDVRWLRVYKPALPHDQLMNNQFSQMTLYELKRSAIDHDKLRALLGATAPAAGLEASFGGFTIGQRFGSGGGAGYTVVMAAPDILELRKPNGKSLPIGMSLLSTLANYVKEGKLTLEDIREKVVFDKVPETTLEPFLVNGYNNVLPALVECLLSAPSGLADRSEVAHADPGAKVLIIDEINRGNVSRIFGELITLIEPSKRAGMSEALELTLPYSKDIFSVPANLYLVGTMNTADRSLAGLDLALRRRFHFKEMAPCPDLLTDVNVPGVELHTLLTTMNERIEQLLDREHRIGHAYFMPLKDDPTIIQLASIFRNAIVPLLQEYFFDDWQRIQWVLNDHRKPAALRFVEKLSPSIVDLFGEGVSVNTRPDTWRINEAAFTLPDAYAGIYALPTSLT
jgi:5-methylcytosine-specific restriction protein B